MSGKESIAVTSDGPGSIIWENLLFFALWTTATAFAVPLYIARRHSRRLRRTVREAHRRAKRELRQWQSTTNSLLTDLVPSY